VTNRHRGAIVAVAALATLMALSTVTSAATFRVRAKDTDAGFRWRPKTLTVPVQSRVVWRIVDGTHNVTSIGSNWSKSSGNIGEGGKTAHTFTKKGTFRYRCTLHSSLSNGKCSGMCGRVVVG
jgi:plastocyanin